MRNWLTYSMENFFENYYSPFANYQYHGFVERSECIKRCTNPLGGLLPVSRLDNLARSLRNESRWSNLCSDHKYQVDYDFESCSFFLDAEFDWQTRVWKSREHEVDKKLWQKTSKNLTTFPRMPVMSELLTQSRVLHEHFNR